MASSNSEDDVITITITNSDQSELQRPSNEEEEEVEEFSAWDFPSLSSYPNTLKIRVHRNRLIERSSFFHGIFYWSFSETSLDHFPIVYDVEASVNVFKFIHGCSIDIDSENFISVYEGSLYYGVGSLIEKCKAWFSNVALSTGPPQIQLDVLISIWNFGIMRARDFIPELCLSYLGRNFMWAASSEFFADIPYDMMDNCLPHKHVTVESEKQWCDGMFVWLDANSGGSERSIGSENNYIDILKQIRLSLLPLDFTSGKRRSHFCKLVNESIASIFRLLNISPSTLISSLEEGDLNNFRIRLSEFSTKVNLSSCTQITTEMILLSLLPSGYTTDFTFRKEFNQLLVKLQRHDWNQFSSALAIWPVVSFELVEEVDISKCRGLHLQASIACFSVSFPSLRRLKAAYLLNFDMNTFRLLVHKCPMIQEVDLTLDMSSVIPEQKSTDSLTVGDMPSIWKPKSTMSNITKLILQGRSELSDSDLIYISKTCSDLRYLNVRGCTTLTDAGISTLIYRQVRLESILVCHTSFGLLSVLALCSVSQGYSETSDQISECMAFNLQTLHIGGCQDVDETSLIKLLSQTKMLKSLCLRDTHLTDHALCSFAGSSLVMLDVSNTMVSGATLSRVVYENPGLKCLRAKGCKNMCQKMSIGKSCKLEELSIGWGFSHLAMEALSPTITLLQEISVGLGGSLGEATLKELPIACPNLESITLQFQVLSDSIIINVMETLKNLRVLDLSYCFGDISISSFKFYKPCIRKLKLERVIPWISNKDLVVLTENCPNLVELSLLGCPNLDSDSQQIISQGWPGLVSLHLEECGEVTANGVSSLLDCVALEDLLLRHNGPGIQSSFILVASLKLPLLRLVSLDLCDSSQGFFDAPSDEHACYLRSVKIAKCKLKECGLALQFVEPRKRPIHKETFVLEWTSKNLVRKVLKERL